MTNRVSTSKITLVSRLHALLLEARGSESGVGETSPLSDWSIIVFKLFLSVDLAGRKSDSRYGQEFLYNTN